MTKRLTVSPLLLQASRLLHVGIASLESVLMDEPGPEELLAVIQVARGNLQQWSDENEEGSVREGFFRAVSMLEVMEAALNSDVDFFAEQGCHTIRNCLEITRELLEQVMTNPTERPRRERASPPPATALLS
jgi:hypothetical protein